MMAESTRFVRTSAWILIVLFGIRLLADVVVVPLTNAEFELTIPSLWWRLLLAGLSFLAVAVLWNAYRGTQRWSWLAMLVTAVILFGGSIAVLARMGDVPWLTVNVVELAIALGALALPYRAFWSRAA
jgi:hypothetical protein